MDKYQVIFNAMGYDFDTLKDYYEELGPDFTTNYEPLVGIKFYPSAVDYNIVTIVGNIFDEFGPEIMSVGIIGAVKALVYLAKKTLKYKNKYENQTTPTIEINYINYTVYISNLTDGDFTDDLEERLTKTIEEKIRNYDLEKNNVEKNQFDVSVFKHDNKDNN